MQQERRTTLLPESAIQFEVETPLGFCVRVTRSYWELIITIKHPMMANREADVRAALSDPEQVRQSRSDPAVLLFYRSERPRRWVCAVGKRLGNEGFLVTAYLTDRIKEGEPLWPR